MTDRNLLNVMTALASPEIASTTNYALGLVCVATLKARGLISREKEIEAAAVILDNLGDPALAAQELFKQGLIDRRNEAAVGEYIKRTVHRSAWRVSRPVAVGRAAHRLHLRQRLARGEFRPPLR